MHKKFDFSILQTTKMMRMMLVEQRLELVKQFEDIEGKIKELQGDIPRPVSICDKFRDCTVCSRHPECGWCNLEQACVEGGSEGPEFGKCDFYEYDFCSGNMCVLKKDCKSCVVDPFCGWA